MFLHLGSDMVVPLRNVIAINTITAEKSTINKEFLSHVQSQKKVIDISEDNAKSFIITDKAVYLSPISSITLNKRAASILENEE